MDELKADRICYCHKDREVPILAGAKALFQAKAIALECNNLDPTRPKTCGQEFWWPVVWKQKRAFICNDHLVSEEIDDFQWEETFIRRGNAISYSRKESIIYLAATWNNYWHIGDVPDRDEVLQLTSVDKTPTKLEAKCNR